MWSIPILISIILSGCVGEKAVVRYSSKPYSVKNSFGKHKYYPEKRYRIRSKHANGSASYYGGKFHNRKTSSCTIYDKNQLTAAHPTAVLPSIAIVTRTDTGKSIHVILNDRGPFAKNRVCDLSVAAARALGYENQGHIKVRITILPQNSKILASHWKKFLHKRLPDELFKHIHSPRELANYLNRIK